MYEVLAHTIIAVEEFCYTPFSMSGYAPTGAQLVSLLFPG